MPPASSSHLCVESNQSMVMRVHEARGDLKGGQWLEAWPSIRTAHLGGAPQGVEEVSDPIAWEVSNVGAVWSGSSDRSHGADTRGRTTPSCGGDSGEVGRERCGGDRERRNAVAGRASYKEITIPFYPLRGTDVFPWCHCLLLSLVRIVHYN